MMKRLIILVFMGSLVLLSTVRASVEIDLGLNLSFSTGNLIDAMTAVDANTKKVLFGLPYGGIFVGERFKLGVEGGLIPAASLTFAGAKITYAYVPVLAAIKYGLSKEVFVTAGGGMAKTYTTGDMNGLSFSGTSDSTSASGMIGIGYRIGAEKGFGGDLAMKGYYFGSNPSMISATLYGGLHWVL